MTTAFSTPRKYVLAVAALMMAFTLVGPAAVPADAIEIDLGEQLNVELTPSLDDFSSCLTITPDDPTVTAVGEFTAVGFVAGPGVQYATVRYAQPIAFIGGKGPASFEACSPGLYEGALGGSVRIQVSVESSIGGYGRVIHCFIANGTPVCEAS